MLFNGGALKGEALRERILAVLRAWGGGDRPRVLEGESLDLAVALGAAYYGLVRRGVGERIGGGSGRAYYVQVEGRGEGSALCVVPLGLEEGETVELDAHAFTARTGQPVAFPLFASTARREDRPGDLVPLDGASLEPLPPIYTVLQFGKGKRSREIPVRLSARLTEVGTLELWCASAETDHRWRLQLQVRTAAGRTAVGEAGDEAGDEPGAAPADLERLPEAVLQRAGAVVRAALGAGEPPAELDELPVRPAPASLVRLLTHVLGEERDAWSLSTNRELWQSAFDVREARGTGEEHEARWLNLTGFCLRPGFGYALDDFRIEELWKLFQQGTLFPRSDRCRAEWWVLWRRASGGLSAGRQNQVADPLEKALREDRKRAAAETGSRKKRRGGAPKGRRLAPQERVEMLLAAASLERLDAPRKLRLAAHPLHALKSGEATRPDYLALARLGARQPLYGPVNLVIPPAEVEPWIELLLAGERPAAGPRAAALVALARRTEDRARDVDPELRSAVSQRLERDGLGDAERDALERARPIENREAAALLGDSVPPGLVLR